MSSQLSAVLAVVFMMMLWQSGPSPSNAQRASEISDSSAIGEKDASDGGRKRNNSNSNSNQNDDVEKQLQKEKNNDSNDRIPGEKHPNIVDLSRDADPENPYNWKPLKKWSIAACMRLMTLFCTFASSVLSSAVMLIATEYGVGSVVAIYSTSLFVLGFTFCHLL